MDEVIVIGARGETRAFALAGLRCFEPTSGRLTERVLAERVRCGVLAMTRRAFDGLPPALACELRTGSWPVLAIVPVVRTGAAASELAERLLALHTTRHPVAA